MTRLWSALTFATACLRTLGRIYIDIASEIDDMASDFKVEIPAELLEHWSEPWSE